MNNNHIDNQPSNPLPSFLTGGDPILVYVTAPDSETAKKLINGVLERKLVACANLVPGIESFFWWQGSIESANEVLILFKTVYAMAPQLESYIRETHPYEIPEFIVQTLSGGSEKYLNWIRTSVGYSEQSSPTI